MKGYMKKGELATFTTRRLIEDRHADRRQLFFAKFVAATYDAGHIGRGHSEYPALSYASAGQNAIALCSAMTRP